jgi:fido (protein-threonine AMPylation protein)
MEKIEKLVDKLEDNIRWWKRAFETDGFESNEEGSYRRELENTKKELYTSIQQELDRAREEVIKNLIKKIEEANCDSISLEFLREIDLSKLTTK